MLMSRWPKSVRREDLSAALLRPSPSLGSGVCGFGKPCGQAIDFKRSPLELTTWFSWTWAPSFSLMTLLAGDFRR